MQPVYLQLVRNVDVLETGMLLIPFSIISSGTALYAGWHIRVSQSFRTSDSRKFFREYKWFTAVSTMCAWIQAISVMVSWTPTTSLNRIMWELCAAGLTGMAYTSLISELVPPCYAQS